jgi:hypothetical protein
MPCPEPVTMAVFPLMLLDTVSSSGKDADQTAAEW